MSRQPGPTLCSCRQKQTRAASATPRVEARRPSAAVRRAPRQRHVRRSRRSTSTTGRRRTASRSPSCWRNAGCRTVIPVNIAHGRTVQAGVPEDLAQQPDAGDRRSATGLAAGRSRCSSPAPSCNISAARPAGSIRATNAARRGRRVAVLADGQPRSEGRRGEPLPALCGGRAAAVRHRALHQRGEPASSA